MGISLFIKLIDIYALLHVLLCEGYTKLIIMMYINPHDVYNLYEYFGNYWFTTHWNPQHYFVCVFPSNFTVWLAEDILLQMPQKVIFVKKVDLVCKLGVKWENTK